MKKCFSREEGNICGAKLTWSWSGENLQLQFDLPFLRACTDYMYHIIVFTVLMFLSLFVAVLRLIVLLMFEKSVILIYNNVTSFVDFCFPALQTLVWPNIFELKYFSLRKKVEVFFFPPLWLIKANYKQLFRYVSGNKTVFKKLFLKRCHLKGLHLVMHDSYVILKMSKNYFDKLSVWTCSHPNRCIWILPKDTKQVCPVIYTVKDMSLLAQLF